MPYPAAAGLPLQQVNTVGKAESAFLPGVAVPEVVAKGAAKAAGFQKGDVILKIDDYTVGTGPSQVMLGT